MTRKIAVSSNKGGILKTSLTVHLAAVLAMDGNKVLIVDTDNQGNASLSFGLQPDEFENTVYDVMVDGIHPNNAIVKAYDNIDILPSNDDLSFLELDVLRNLKKFPKPYSLLQSLRKVEDNYDYMIFDTPPNLGLAQGNVLEYVKEVVIPFQPEVYAMRSLLKTFNAIQSFKDETNHDLRVLGVVATMVDRRTNLHKDIIEKTRAYCEGRGVNMFNTVIPRSIKYANSIAKRGLPATLDAGNEMMIQPYTKLKEELTNG